MPSLHFLYYIYLFKILKKSWCRTIVCRTVHFYIYFGSTKHRLVFALWCVIDYYTSQRKHWPMFSWSNYSRRDNRLWYKWQAALIAYIVRIRHAQQRSNHGNVFTCQWIWNSNDIAVKFANWELSPLETLPMCNFSLSIYLHRSLDRGKKQRKIPKFRLQKRSLNIVIIYSVWQTKQTVNCEVVA